MRATAIHWFKHDSNANMDAKLKKVRIKYGMEGYGLYWYCLELIASDVGSTNITFELEHDSEIIAHDTGIHVERVNEMMAYMVDLGLFETHNGAITCMRMAKRLDQSMTSNPQMRGIIKGLRENHDGVMTESCKNRLEENRLEENTNKAFDSFWENYPKKQDKKKAEIAFNRLSKEKQQKAITDCKTRFKDTEKRFIPLATTYIHGERWEDEIIEVKLEDKVRFPRRGDCEAWVAFAFDLGLKPNVGELQPSFERRIINYVEAKQ